MAPTTVSLRSPETGGSENVNGLTEPVVARLCNSGMVIYRSKLHATLKRNYQLMPALKWLRLLLNHVPDKYEHLVRSRLLF